MFFFALGSIVVLFVGHAFWMYLELSELGGQYLAAGEVGYRDLYDAEKLESVVLDAVIGEQGYLLTGEASFLELYSAGREQIEAAFARLSADIKPGTPSWQVFEKARLGVEGWLVQTAEKNIAWRRNGVNGQQPLSWPEIKARIDSDGEAVKKIRGNISDLVDMLRRDQQGRLALIDTLHSRLVYQVSFSTVSAVSVVLFLMLLLWGRVRFIEKNNLLLAEQEGRLKAVVRQLESASRQKSEFLANMSHELRTPLNAVLGFAQVLRKQAYGPLTDKQKEYVEYILTSGRHLLDLINEVLDLSKIEAGKVELELTLLSLPQIIEKSMLMVKEKARMHRIKLTCTVAEDVPQVTADERKIRQVIYNLLANAVKFTPDGGKVKVAVRMAPSGRTGARRCVEISVSDTGIGIPLAEQERIFEPFVQLDSGPARRYEGTGLGLALVKSFVELHGGRVWVHSEGEGKGSVFFFTLPVDPGEGGGQ